MVQVVVGGHAVGVIVVDVPVLKLALSWPSVRGVKQRLVADGDGQLGAGDVLPVSAGLFKPGLSHLACVVDRLLLARAMVAPTAAAVAVRLLCVVAFGVAAALTAIGVAGLADPARAAGRPVAAAGMTASTWPVVTCTACGATGPGRPKVGLCKRCYARAQHPVQPCPGCGQTRRHLAAGLCAPCYRLSRTRLLVCPSCGEQRPVHFGDRCERCKRRAAACAGSAATAAKVARLWSDRCTTCRNRFYETTGACHDCGDLTRLTSGLCSACRLFRWKHPLGICPYCGREQPIGRPGPAGPARPRTGPPGLSNGRSASAGPGRCSAPLADTRSCSRPASARS